MSRVEDVLQHAAVAFGQHLALLVAEALVARVVLLCGCRQKSGGDVETFSHRVA